MPLGVNQPRQFSIAAREFGTLTALGDFSGVTADEVIVAVPAGFKAKIAGVVITTDSSSGLILLEWDESPDRIIIQARDIERAVRFGELGASPDLITGSDGADLLLTAPADTAITVEYFLIPTTP